MKQRYLSTLALILIVMSFLLLSCGLSSAALAPSQANFPNAQLLVSGTSVESSMGEPYLVIIDARSSADYAASHIPGAININYSDFFTFGKGLLPVATLNTKLSAAGLTKYQNFVIYDNTSASFGAAGRLFWMLEYLGCSYVQILDGGWDKWVADGRTTETTVNTLTAATFSAEVQTAIKATYQQVNQKRGDADFALIDTRTDEEYIGWQLYGEARGGHIPGAVQIPYAWYFNADKTVLDYADLKAMFEERGVTPDKEVVSYCTCGIRSGFAYFLMRLMGFPMAANYDGSIAEWASKPSLPEEKAARFYTIVYPDWVQALKNYASGQSATPPPHYYLPGGNPSHPYPSNHPYIIFETQWGTLPNATAYNNGHIPGAIHSNSDTYENGGPKWYLIPDSDLQTAAGSMGITPDTTVIVYSDSSSYSARLFWILTYLGVKDVRYLNGGYNAWLAVGYTGETTANNPVAVTFNPSTPIQSQYRATTTEVANNIKHNRPMYLGDVRSEEEYIGSTSGYSYLIEMGRIPTAVWLYNASSKFTEYNDLSDGTLRSYTEVLNMWKSRGIKSSVQYKTFSKELVFHCGNGYRSSLAFLYAYMMGYNNVKNYSSGWSEWSTSFCDPTTDTNCSCSQTYYGYCEGPSGRTVLEGFPQ